MPIVRAASILSLAVVIASCVDNPSDPTSRRDASRGNVNQGDSVPAHAARMAMQELQAARAGRQENVEDEFLRLELDAPGFGGFYFDQATQRTVVVVKDLAEKERALSAVRALAVRRPGGPLQSVLAGAVDVQQGRYALSELIAWKKVLRAPLFRVRGVLSIDADEQHNRVTVEVADAAARMAAEQVVTVAGAGEVVSVVLGTPTISASHRLNSKVRATMGGFQIIVKNPGPFYSLQLCTLGWNIRTDQNELGFLTASHCDIGPDGTGSVADSVNQADYPPSGDRVGKVAINPAWPAQCDDGTQVPCPQADVMFVAHSNPANSSFRVGRSRQIQAFNNTPGTRERDSDVAVPGARSASPSSPKTA